MSDYPKFRECVTLQANATINADLPPEIALVRGGKVLQFTIAGTDSPLTIGITRDGLLCGFEHTGPENRAAVLVLRKPAGGFSIYRAAQSPQIDFERVLEPLCPPSGDYLAMTAPYGLASLLQRQQQPPQSAPSGPTLRFGGNGISAGILGGWA